MGNLSHTLPSKCCSYTQAMQKQLGLTAVFHGSKAGWIKFPLPNRKIGDAFSSIICYNEKYETAAVPDRPAFQIGAPIWTRSTSHYHGRGAGHPAGPAAEARRKKQREKRRRLLRRLVPCGLLAVLCVGLVTVGAQLIEKPAPEMVKAERPFQVTSVASAPAPEPYARAVSGPDTIQLGEDFPSRCAVLVDLDTRTVLAEKNADTVISPAP